MSSIIVAVIFVVAAAMISLAPVPEQIRRLKTVAASVIGLFGVAIAMFGGISYNDAGYCMHIRTIFGSESVKCDLGWYVSGWGQSTQWPHYITIANTTDADADGSAVTGPYTIRMADNWSGVIRQTTRFGIPQDQTQFLKMARDFRSPERLITTTLRPAVTSSLDSVANLYTMEEYWSGGKRDEFKTEFENAVKKGRPAIDREEISVLGTPTNPTVAPSDSDVVVDTADTGGSETTRVVTRKRVDANGMDIRISHDYVDYGITVSSAIVEQLDPDNRFEERIQERKEAASRRIIAREQRLEQEEQRLLAITKSERDIAERQGQARVEQIERTTNAETEKRLALVEAEKYREQAKITQQTAEIELERAKIVAESVKVTADANAYERERLLEADNALQMKLNAEIEIQKVWAEAYAKRHVPSVVIGSGGPDGAPTGSDGEVSQLLKMLTVETAKRLAYDRDINEKAQ